MNPLVTGTLHNVNGDGPNRGVQTCERDLPPPAALRLALLQRDVHTEEVSKMGEDTVEVEEDQVGVKAEVNAEAEYGRVRDLRAACCAYVVVAELKRMEEGHRMGCPGCCRN
jgi:hypothetical protein